MKSHQLTIVLILLQIFICVSCNENTDKMSGHEKAPTYKTKNGKRDKNVDMKDINKLLKDMEKLNSTLEEGNKLLNEFNSLSSEELDTAEAKTKSKGKNKKETKSKEKNVKTKSTKTNEAKVESTTTNEKKTKDKNEKTESKTKDEKVEVPKKKKLKDLNKDVTDSTKMLKKVNKSSEIDANDEQTCIGKTCLSKAQMQKTEEVLKPIFEQIHQKVFVENPKYRDLEYDPNALMDPDSMDPELKKEIANATYGILQNVNVQDIMDAMPMMQFDKMQEQLKKNIKAQFDLFDVHNKGYITYMDVGYILKDDGDDDLDNDWIDDAEVNHLIHKCDADQSGNIDLKEFTRLIALAQKRTILGIDFKDPFRVKKPKAKKPAKIASKKKDEL